MVNITFQRVKSRGIFEILDAEFEVDKVTSLSTVFSDSKGLYVSQEMKSFICSMEGLERRSNLRACLVALLLLSIASSTVAYASSPPSSISSSPSSPPPTSSKGLC